MLNAFLTISDTDRAGRLQPIIEEFIALAAAARQKVSGELITVLKLDDATLARLVAELSRITGKSVELFQKIDPSILGGVIIKVGEQVIDGSLRRRLEKIQENLAADDRGQKTDDGEQRIEE